MADFTFVTSNNHKVLTAAIVCRQFGISFDHQAHDLVEIQADNGHDVAIDKARKAYEVYKRPIAITDDNWLIPALNGFPGPYMKYINQWFSPEDFLRLTKDLKDRSIIMRQIIVFKNKSVEKVFSVDIKGTLLKEVRGSSSIPHFAVMSFDGGQHSVAEFETGSSTSVAEKPNAWHQLCQWLNTSSISQQTSQHAKL